LRRKMRVHHVRTAKSIDDNPKRHLFVEFERDSWLELKEIPPHSAIHQFIKQERKNNVYNMRVDSRAFRIGIIKNWREEQPIIA